MKNYLLFCCYAGCAILMLFSCKGSMTSGHGAEGTDTRNVSSFNAITIEAPLNASITVKEGAQPSVQLSGYNNLLQQIKTDIKDNTLHIYTPQGWSFYTDKEVKAEITVPSLTALSLAGDVTADIHGNVSGSKFNMDISGAGNVSIDNINVSDFSTTVSGGGRIAIKGGNVTHASYDVSGASNIKAFPMQSVETTASISGSGEAEVNAQQKLNSHISGAAEINYKGHPALISDISGVGTVNDAN